MCASGDWISSIKYADYMYQVINNQNRRCVDGWTRWEMAKSIDISFYRAQRIQNPTRNEAETIWYMLWHWDTAGIEVRWELSMGAIFTMNAHQIVWILLGHLCVMYVCMRVFSVAIWMWIVGSCNKRANQSRSEPFTQFDIFAFVFVCIHIAIKVIWNCWSTTILE